MCVGGTLWTLVNTAWSAALQPCTPQHIRASVDYLGIQDQERSPLSPASRAVCCYLEQIYQYTLPQNSAPPPKEAAEGQLSYSHLVTVFSPSGLGQARYTVYFENPKHLYQREVPVSILSYLFWQPPTPKVMLDTSDLHQQPIAVQKTGWVMSKSLFCSTHSALEEQQCLHKPE